MHVLDDSGGVETSASVADPRVTRHTGEERKKKGRSLEWTDGNHEDKLLSEGGFAVARRRGAHRKDASTLHKVGGDRVKAHPPACMSTESPTLAPAAVPLEFREGKVYAVCRGPNRKLKCERRS